MKATRDSILAYAREQYGVEEQHLWTTHPLYAVLRHGESGPWFGLLADVVREKLTLDGKGYVDVLVVKADPAYVLALLDRPGYLPAYHMNKKNWISILLDGSVPAQDVFDLFDDSWRLTK